MGNILPVKINSRIVRPHKAAISADLKTRNVLTNSLWEFVELWLKKEKKEDAVLYWTQAREFHLASKGLPRESSPLLHYYSYMNAAKALLSAKGISFDPYHGVSSHNMRGTSNKINLSNEGIKIKNNGVLPSLSSYLEETEQRRSYSLQELLFNLPYIHRTYCLTYKSQRDMYIPVKNAHFVCDKAQNILYLRATLSGEISNAFIERKLPSFFDLESKGDEYIVKSTVSEPFTRPSRSTQSDINNLISLHKKVRKNLVYINGSQTLWYIKGDVAGPSKINRSTLTITLAAMHRLSELSRYHPVKLNSFLSGQKNWLINEFLSQSPNQFFDEIAAEITGHTFLLPNVRLPN